MISTAQQSSDLTTPLDFHEAEALAYDLVRARATLLPGLVDIPSGVLHPWRWRRGSASVELWMRFVPGERFYVGRQLYVHCTPRPDVLMSSAAAALGRARIDDAALRLSNAVMALAKDVKAELSRRPIVRLIESATYLPRRNQ